MMEECIFCKIVSGEIPADKIYEDDLYLAFLDIMPINPGHTLVIPKEHYENMSETKDELLSGLMVLSKKIGKAVMSGLEMPAYNIGINTGREAGQAVFHTHIHVIPRFEGDGHKMWGGGKYEEDEASKVAHKIKSNL